MSETAGFIVDLNRCTGCRACELACVIANQRPADGSWRRVHDYNESHLPGLEAFHLSLACNHCSRALCLEQCPARAIHRCGTTGAVLIDEAKCIGCGYCGWVCPWDAPRLDHQRGVTTKCTVCHERVAEGREPACVMGCPTGALGWGERTVGGAMPAIPGFSDADTDPVVTLVPLAESRRLPAVDEPPALPPWRDRYRRILPKIRLAEEWPLALFTLLLALLVGLLIGGQLGAPAMEWRLFAGAGLAGLLVSAAHLGRKSRVWRAGLNVPTSWLSREVLLFGGFLAVGTASLHPAVEATWPGWLAVMLGLGAALAADMVYRVASVRWMAGSLHSALLLPTALLLAAAWGGAIRAALVISTMKMALYLIRALARRRQGDPIGALTSMSRVGMLALGSSWLAVDPVAGGIGPLLLIATSELIDRFGYYDELEIPTPDTLMRDDLDRRTFSL
jgi:Fe-S-cluster-containing dehydrogenase component